jgi:hypothetical protein
MPPGGEKVIVWSFLRKFESLTTLGAIGNIPYEFVFPSLILLVFLARFWSGAMRLDGRRAAGLLALLVCFIVLPARVHAATLVDLRMILGIAAIVLAVAEERPAWRWPAFDLAAKYLIVFLVAARVLSFAVLWIPMNALAAPYAELSKMVKDGSAVAFVYDGRHAPQRQRLLIEEWLEVVRTRGAHLPLDNLLIYADYWHLHMYYFRGRDVFLSNLFLNFFIRSKEDRPFPVVETPLPILDAIDVVGRAPYDYVLSHIDLSHDKIAGKRLCVLAERGTAILYQVVAQDAPACGPAR